MSVAGLKSCKVNIIGWLKRLQVTAYGAGIASHPR
jgi:hypothetical protein